MTHTKGPWSLDGDLSAMNLDVVYGSGRIAMMECENDELSDDEVTANARLMAAAPDLLAALEALHACHRAFSGNDNWTMLDDEARALAENAIAKARGE